MKLPLNRLGAVTLARMIAAGECSPQSVARSFLDAIAEHEPTVQAYAWLDAEQALASAGALHRAARGGPLHGLPVAVKDNIDTADAPTACGSGIFSGHRPQTDAACVALLKDAGAYVLGKTVLAEFANSTPGPTRNPHAPAHTPGGSSSGSAAAVAAHMAPLALGTQTAGSVIRPAAFCGVVGYKPSPRLVPRAGVKPNSDTLDEVGVFARSVEDAALAAAVLAAQPAWRELPAQGAGGAAPALGSVATPRQHLASAAALAALERTVRRLARQGARLSEVAWPRPFDGLFEAQQVVQLFETARALAPEFMHRRQELSPRLVEVIEQGRATPAARYAAALQLGRACAAAIDGLFGTAEVLLTLSAPGEAPAGLESTGDPVFNRPWQLLGCPMINLPVPRGLAQGDHGLPLGLTLLARPGDETRLWAAAGWIEARLGADG